MGEDTWPRLDVLTGKTGLAVLVEIASVLPEDLEVSEDGGKLIIEGERAEDDGLTGFEKVVKEIPRGKFRREIEVPPDFDLTRATAAWRNGMLRIDVPKKAAGKKGKRP